MQNALALHRYRTVSDQTKSSEDVLVALLEGACLFVSEAKDAVRAKDLPRKAKAIDKALAIIGELASALDPALSPDVVPKVAALYSFAQQQLLAGSLALNLTHLDAASRVLEAHCATMREAIRLPR